MSELNDPKRIGSAPEQHQIEAHHEPQQLPGYDPEVAQAEVETEEKVTKARYGLMGAGSAVILVLATIIVAALLLLVTNGGHGDFGKTDKTAFYMGPTNINKPGAPLKASQSQVAAIFATSPRAAATAVGKPVATTAGQDIPVVVYLFNYDSNNVPENEALTELAADLSASGRDVAIVAYTDPRGSKDYNQRLSERRAKAIGNYLVAHGVDRANITTTGAGATNAYPTAALDRRAVITPQ